METKEPIKERQIPGKVWLKLPNTYYNQQDLYKFNELKQLGIDSELKAVHSYILVNTTNCSVKPFINNDGQLFENKIVVFNQHIEVDLNLSLEQFFELTKTNIICDLCSNSNGMTS